VTMWRRVAARREEVRRLVDELGCVTASELARRLGLSHTQAVYTLKMLEGIVSYKIGRIRVWCASPVPPDALYATIHPCFRYVEEALREILEGARGSIVTLTPGALLKAAARLYRRDCAAASPHLLAAARRWLETRLDGAILTWSRNEWRDMKYIIDVKKAREKLAVGYV